jgi:transcription elongation factor/antiterminator RfaH
MIQSITTSHLPEPQKGKAECQPLWYAAYTASRHEKKVAEHLKQRDVECFLPLYETIRQWNNGRHRVQMPLFPGYVFVRIEMCDRMRVLQVPGLVQLVTFQGAPAALPDGEIETLRNALATGVPAQPHRYLNVGSKVEICRGPLQGMRGVLLRQQGQFRVVISVEMIMRSVVVEVEATDVVAIGRKNSLALTRLGEAPQAVAASA